MELWYNVSLCVCTYVVMDYAGLYCSIFLYGIPKTKFLCYVSSSQLSVYRLLLVLNPNRNKRMEREKNGEYAPWGNMLFCTFNSLGTCSNQWFSKHLPIYCEWFPVHLSICRAI